MIVHRPAAEGDQVLKLTLCLNVMLGQHVVADVAAALTLAGQEADPFQLPILCVMVAVVLDVIPDAEGDLEQIVADLLGIVDAVAVAAQLDPPEVGLVGAILWREGEVRELDRVEVQIEFLKDMLDEMKYDKDDCPFEGIYANIV